VTSCLVTALGDSSVQLTLRVCCAEPGISKKIECELYEQAKKGIDQEGIEIPFPYRNIIIKEQPAAA
jgi:small-conductance mechanosensitive channel